MDVAVATIFVVKIDLHFTPCIIRMTFARAATPTYDKKGNCFAGRRQTNYLIRWMQANQLCNKLTLINRRRGDKPMGYRETLPCIKLKMLF